MKIKDKAKVINISCDELLINDILSDYESICDDLIVNDLEDEKNEINNNSKNDEEINSDKEESDDFHWSEICTNWFDLAKRENQFDNEEDNHLLEMVQDFHAAGRNIHPADDKTAKWKLEYLFKEDLTFLGIELNNSNYKSSEKFV
ncbi:hypothetical protein GLOIN_2v1469334 [Rhizophagus clarus]|uniref:Uncharacterized protein n=1 Tax=Rhizophagus clarus TaxID=94130 RepID=A0A8H3M9J1_9GLOM|nr:hypothetical protein GLOIN_2v1469334 [Rhizophagus clarus]